MSGILAANLFKTRPAGVAQLRDNVQDAATIFLPSSKTFDGLVDQPVSDALVFCKPTSQLPVTPRPRPFGFPLQYQTGSNAGFAPASADPPD